MKTGTSLSVAVLMVLLTLAGFVVPQSEEQETKRIYVRHLAWPDVLDLEKVRSKATDNPMMLKSASAVLKLVDKKAMKALTAGVNFNEEMIVLVRWETGGPLYGTLQHEAKGDGLNFFVQAPDPAEEWRLYRGVRKKLAFSGADFFVIPRDVPVTMDQGGERPYPKQ